MYRGDRVGLRHVTEADLPLIIEIAEDPVLRSEFQSSRMGNPHDLRQRFANDGISNEEHEMLMICDETDRAIGHLVHFRARRYSSAREIGWIISDTGRRRHGYATEAAGLLIDYLFENLPIQRIECGVSPLNMPSRRVAEKLGFVLEGRARGLLFVGGEFVDGDIFSMLRPEWAERRRAAAPART